MLSKWKNGMECNPYDEARVSLQAVKVGEINGMDALDFPNPSKQFTE